MKISERLLEHPYWESSNPHTQRLVRASKPLPDVFNPFAADRVMLIAAGVPGEAKHSKSWIGREGILDGISTGCITEQTRVYEATSGNTGQGMAETCNALAIRFHPIVSGDVPQDKINALRVFGRYVEPELHFSTEETTVDKARRLGKLDGNYNPDQYAGMWNPLAHRKYLAPQLWQEVGRVPSLIVTPAGTMGTSMGLAMYAKDRGFSTNIVPVVCASGEEVPGARTRARIEKDILLPWRKFFKPEDIEEGPRHESFLLSFLSWQFVPQSLGPTFGLALYGAFRHLWKHKQAKTLEQFRNSDGNIIVVVFGPDDNRLYTQLYLTELTTDELSARAVPQRERMLETIKLLS